MSRVPNVDDLPEIGTLVTGRSDGHIQEAAAASAHDDTGTIGSKQVWSLLDRNIVSIRDNAVKAEGPFVMKQEPVPEPAPWRWRRSYMALGATITPRLEADRIKRSTMSMQGTLRPRWRGQGPAVRWRSKSRERVNIGSCGTAESAQRALYRVHETHELHPPDCISPCLMDSDKEAWDEEMRRRTQRNDMIKQKLIAGWSVLFRSTGWSLYPRVHSDDCTLFHPVLDPTNIRKNDVVFCEVNPGHKMFAHKVLRVHTDKTWEDPKTGCISPKRWFEIGNWNGIYNGFAWEWQVYGRLVEVYP